MNAETSAWGRAIIAVGASDSKRGVASRQEVRNRVAERGDGLPQNRDGSLLGQMVEAGVETTGAGERFFSEMARTVRSAA